jgi:uncharacterized protein (TIGR02996 family)
VNTNEELLRGILEHPFDDARRLVYADWCDENGEPLRAAFIRWGFQKHCGRFPGLRYRQWGFPWWQGQSHWSRSWRQSPCINLGKNRALDPWQHGQHCFITKGWVTGIYLPLEAFVQHAQDIFRSQPVVYANLLDREPWGNDDVGWRWWPDPDDLTYRHNHNAPGLLVDLTGVQRFATRQEAKDVLGVACVDYGRSLAGLGKLDRPKADRPKSGGRSLGEWALPGRQ